MTPEQTALVRLQDERWRDPATARDAEERMARVRERLYQLEPQLERQKRAMERTPHFKRRLIWLREITATMASAVQPESACRGCSHCCYQPVMVSQAEAEVIAKETGAKLAHPRWRTEAAVEYSGHACPFLKAGKCSIYQHRPMACRQLYNMDRDSLQCRIVPGAPTKVPYANLQQLTTLLLQIHDERERAEGFRLADLREFFPARQPTHESAQ